MGNSQRLPDPINSAGNEWFPRTTPDGALWFGSDRAGGHGRTDIWRAQQDDAGAWHVENAGPAINGENDEYEPQLSPLALGHEQPSSHASSGSKIGRQVRSAP